MKITRGRTFNHNDGMSELRRFEMSDVKRLAEKIRQLISKYRNTYHPNPDDSNKSFNEELEGLLREAMDEAVKEFAEGRRTYTTHDFTREKECEFRGREQGRAEAYTRAAEVARDHDCRPGNYNCSCRSEIAAALIAELAKEKP
jgi:hypothetical protein